MLCHFVQVSYRFVGVEQGTKLMDTFRFVAKTTQVKITKSAKIAPIGNILICKGKGCASAQEEALVQLS